MWPFKHKSEFINMSPVQALMLILLALTLASNLIVLVKVKMLYKDQAKMRDTVIQLQSSMMMPGGKLNDPRIMQQRPPNIPTPKPTPKK